MFFKRILFFSLLLLTGPINSSVEVMIMIMEEASNLAQDLKRRYPGCLTEKQWDEVRFSNSSTVRVRSAILNYLKNPSTPEQIKLVEECKNKFK